MDRGWCTVEMRGFGEVYRKPLEEERRISVSGNASAKDATIADLWEKGGNGYHCSLEGTFKIGKWK
ncbi:hypothetical protein CK203_088675 [Vitis vinifera]|uniref:Uncharacterized protein n=1 Tax=Vitis vinifera TaxID=29760 RepID=A0A438D448_VITVI|nr:hypothetical protein CK203_088675 [Vitis vinifera]